MTWNPDVLGRLKFLNRSLDNLGANQLPLSTELLVGSHNTNKHLVQIDSAGGIIDLAATSGQQDSVGIDCAYVWNFETGLQGWTSTIGTLTWQAANDCAVLAAAGAGVSNMQSPLIAVDGNKYRRVKIAVKILSAGLVGAWSSRFTWSTDVNGSASLGNTAGGSNHAINAAIIRQVTPEPVSYLDKVYVIDYDLESALIGTVAADDWITNTITRIRYEPLGAGGVGNIQVLWVAICSNAPPLSTKLAGINDSGEIRAVKLESSTLSELITPPANTLYLSAERDALMVPKYVTPEGGELTLSPFDALGKNLITFSPSTGTTGVGTPQGGTWTSNGTVTHPAVVTTTKSASLMGTRWANVATTQNQTLGPLPTGSAIRFCRRYGFYYYALFRLDIIPTAGSRLFVGLTAGIATIVNNDNVANNTIGLWRETTTTLTGGNAVFLVRDTSTNTVQVLSLPALASNQAYELFIYSPAAGTNIRYKLVAFDTGAVVAENTIAGNLPADTVMLAPHAAMSNGTANTTVASTAFGLIDLRCIRID
jgi:hypothetical protein